MRYLIVFAVFILSRLALGAPPVPVIDLNSLTLDETTRSQLMNAIISDAPSLILVTDNTTLNVAAFVTTEPENMDPNKYVLVDILPSTNKTITGEGFHAATESRLKKIGVTCSTRGCINLMPAQAENLFQEVKNNFSSYRNGSDVLVLSSDGANRALPASDAWSTLYSSDKSYKQRSLEISSLKPDQEKTKYLRKLSPLNSLKSDWNQEKILIDATKPIAGNGDTASSLFLVQNLIHRGFKGQIDILVDDKSERIISTLSRNMSVFQNQIRLIRDSELPAAIYSIVIRSGQPSGRIFLEKLKQNKSQTSRPQSGKINVSEKTIYFSFTIYGNTRNKYSLQPLSLSTTDNKFYLLPSTGLDAVRSAESHINISGRQSDISFAEAGIFRDPFSLSIRHWSLKTIENFLLKETQAINPDLHVLLQQLISNRKLNNSKYSLAYGFSIPQVKSQARDYFRSLLASPNPIVVLTPSAFGETLLKSFTDEEKSKIQLTTLAEFREQGHQLKKNHLTVVQIPNVPHPVFASLLLASNRNRVVPLGSGDGFFTTALSLGIPFSPTIVEWNIRNVRALSRVLQIEALRKGFSFDHLQNLRRVYSAIGSDPIQLAFSQQLLRYEELFRSAIFKIPDLTETIDSTVNYLRKKSSLPEHLKAIEKADHLFVKSTENIESNYGYGGGKSCSSLF
ncbi:MAG: hypothetical protein V4654_01795 [Bdellovibrionota bacterium]